MLICCRDSQCEKYFKYKHDNKILGSFYLKETSEGFEISSFQITPAYRCKGYGTKMMSEIIAMHEPLILNVLKSNTTAIHLYKKMGFVIVGNNADTYRMKFVPSGMNK